MTDEPKSCAQINEEVALHLEWVKDDETYPPNNIWVEPTSRLETSKSGQRSQVWKTQDNPPDYCGKWAHAGPLWSKLWENREDDRDLLVYEVEIIQYELDCELTEAITRALHAAVVEEGE